MWKALSIEETREYLRRIGRELKCSVKYNTKYIKNGYNKCGREVLIIKDKKNNYKIFDKCIFHVKKVNKYWMENYEEYLEGKKVKAVWNNDLVVEFWKLIREYREVDARKNNWGIKYEKEYNFSYFIFPSFERFNHDFEFEYVKEEKAYEIEVKYYGPPREHFGKIFLVNEKEKIIYDEKIKISADCNFWKKGEYAEFSGYVDFSNCIFLEDVNFEGVYFLDARFDHCYFLSDAVFSQSYFLSAYFASSIFLGSVYFDESQIQYADFSDARFYSYVSFSLSNLLKGVDFSETEFFYDVSFVNAYFKDHAKFLNTKFLKNADFSGSEMKNIYFSNIKCLQTTINFQDTLIDSLSNITIIIGEAIKKDNTKSKLKIIFPNVSKNFTVIDSDFSGFDEVCFDGNIEDVRFINVNWGDVSWKRYCPDVSDIRKRRDIYRQIKLALDKQENYIDARKFYALEMKAYKEQLLIELKSEIGRIAGLIRSTMKNLKKITDIFPDLFQGIRKTLYIFSELVVYLIHEKTSSFGMSWVKPLFWLILIAIFYGFREQVRFYIYWCFPEGIANVIDTLSSGLNFLAKQILLILPSGISKHSEGFEAVTLLYYSFTAYLIYQFVMALRRKVRR